MAIHIYKHASRSPRRVGLYDEDPDVQMRKALGPYELFRLTLEGLDDPSTLQTTDAVVFIQRADKPAQVLRALEGFAAKLLTWGCWVFVLPASGAEADQRFRPNVVRKIGALKLPVWGLSIEEIRQHLGEEGVGRPQLSPLVRVLNGPDHWAEIAADLRYHRRDPLIHAAPTVTATSRAGGRLSLDAEEELLLHRAFADCSEVHLREMQDGLSGVRAFRAIATPRNPTTGARSAFQHLVKVGERGKVSTEYQAYREKALGHIPFHLGPRLELGRCVLGSSKGLIVSDYVDGAESLCACAREGRAVPVIANLFNVTLRPWAVAGTEETRALADYVADRWLPEIPEHRRQTVVDYAGSADLGSLRLRLGRITAPERRGIERVQVGVVHGDLHAGNVLVRGTDAILIDFERVEDGQPLLRDLACLEGGLFVDGFTGDPRLWGAVLESVAPLYSARALEWTESPGTDRGDRSHWFYECVRQIRMHAQQLERVRFQYAICLALELARKSCNPREFPKPHLVLSTDDTRALAFVLAEKLIASLDSASSSVRGS